ncbi:unnamed protein product [Rodentolepis nana]|uniref:Uncharacterized protein n=1 Tax=Rodentolepis nana TaxID=102285 RepID=A0A0R3TL52_RODNA|nr:unnamed protein product [Rodentolepis nana]
MSHYRFRCSELSHEIAQFFSHRQISSSMSSSSLKPITSDLNLKSVLAKCLISRWASKPDKLINLLYCLKFLCNVGRHFYRGPKSNLWKLSSFGDSRRTFGCRIGSNVRCEKTAPHQLKAIFEFADRLSRGILSDLQTSMGTTFESELNNPCTAPCTCKATRRRYYTSAAPEIENAAERLEQSIMREALIFLHRLWHFQNHRDHYGNSLNTLSSQQSQSNSKLLTKFSNDIASQIMKETSCRID